MPDLDQSTKAALLALKNKREESNQPTTTQETPISVESESSQHIVKSTSSTPSTDGTGLKDNTEELAVPSSEKPKETEKPKEEKKVDTNKASTDEAPTEKVDDLSDPTFDLGLDEEAPKPTDNKSVDFKRIGSALEIEASTQEELISKVSEKFSKLKEAQEATFSGVPDDLKQAIEIAKKGGDWKSYTSSLAVDVEKIDPLDLFDREFERVEAQRFKNPDGSIDYEKLDEELNSIPDGIKRMQGNAIKQQISNQQKARQAAVMVAVEQAQDKFQKSLGDAVKDLPSMLPKEAYGVTFEPKHSSYLYEGRCATGAGTARRNGQK